MSDPATLFIVFDLRCRCLSGSVFHRCHIRALDQDKAGGEEARGSSDARVRVLVAYPPETAGQSPHHLLGRGDGLSGLKVSVVCFCYFPFSSECRAQR